MKAETIKTDAIGEAVQNPSKLVCVSNLTLGSALKSEGVRITSTRASYACAGMGTLDTPTRVGMGTPAG